MRPVQAALVASMLVSLSSARQAVGDTARRSAIELLPVETGFASIDDSVPNPVRAVSVAGPSGDQIVAAASGDPNFLSFTAGPYYPPADELIDPLLVGSLRTSYADSRPTQDTYAFVMFDKRITDARIARLEAVGARVVEFHPFYTLKVALPPQAIDPVAALDFVRWIGVARPWQKLDPALDQAIATLPDGELLDVFVNVFDSDLCDASSYVLVAQAQEADPGRATRAGTRNEQSGRAWMSNGWQQHALEGLGVHVVEYLDVIRAFRARIAPASLEALVELDFVQFIEPDVRPQLLHDESTPMVLSDYMRDYFDGGYTGGAMAAQIDSGYERDHEALDHLFSVGYEATSEDDPFRDDCGHGSHVAGTIVGRPPAIRGAWTGNAPGLGFSSTRRFRSAKVFDAGCRWAWWVSSGSLFDLLDDDYTDTTGQVSPPPQVINNSWGNSGTYNGTDGQSRILDSFVYYEQQLYVFAAGNDGPNDTTINTPGVAKNAFTVGSINDSSTSEGEPGDVSNFSSRGPTGDGRWKPNVVAPGHVIRSVDSQNISQYVNKSGTSMATPHVVGVAAQLCDQFQWLRQAPAVLASVLMANAMTHDDVALTTPADWHLSTYGAGLINAARAGHWSLGEGSNAWSFTQYTGGYKYGDFVVYPGCKRIVVCLTYHELPASAGAWYAVVNDFDLYIDSPTNGISSAGDFGEYFAQQSSVDNTEIRTINNPIAGTWRWKSWPESVNTMSKVGVTVSFVYEDTTPDGTLTLSSNVPGVRPGQTIDITATAYNPEFYASNVFLDSSSSGDALSDAYATLYDGYRTFAMSNMSNGRDIMLGMILPNSSRSATWRTSWATEGLKSWTVSARSDNWVDKNAALQIYVDGNPPFAPTNVQSSTHPVGAWGTATTLSATWNPSYDNLGVAGYSYSITPNASSPDLIKDITVPALISPMPGTGTWFLNLRAVDHASNWSTSYISYGPMKNDATAPTAVSNLASATHTANSWTCTSNAELHWSAAVDTHSGIAGYVVMWDGAPLSDPTGALNVAGGATSWSGVIPFFGPNYAHVRTRDLAGNWGPTTHFGPVTLMLSFPQSYCTAKTNSLGCAPTISSLGSPSKSAGTFQVTCTNVLNNKNGLLFWGFSQATTPFQGGWKCVASPTVRAPTMSSGGSAAGNNCSGTYAFTFTTAYMNQYGIDPAEYVYCQWWTRDPNSPSATGLSAGLYFSVCP